MTKIIGVGSYLPDGKYDNKFFEKRVRGVNAEWTEKRLNIKERRVFGTFRQYANDVVYHVDTPFAVVHMGKLAARAALDSAAIDAEEIDLVIVGTTTHGIKSPSAACSISNELGCISAVSFDVSAACAGFGYALSVANAMIDTGVARTALVIGSDAYSTITDWGDRNCIFFGDGAGAIVLTRGNSIISTVLGSDCRFGWAWHTSHNEFGREVWGMDSKAVFNLAVSGIVKSVTDALGLANLSVDDIDILIPHQPGIEVLKAVADRLGLPFSKVYTVMDRYANTAAASVPIALDDALGNGKIRSGNIVVLATVGAGWTWSASVLRWV